MRTISSTSAAARIASRRSSPAISPQGRRDRGGRGGGAALLAVCGGYQLLGRGYRGLGGADLPGVGLFPHETVAGERRMIGDVLLECELEPGERRTLAGFENHAGRTRLDPGAEPLGRVVAGFGNDGESGYEGCRVGRAIGTYLHGPLLPRNPWLADWLLAQALAHADGGEPPELEPLDDTLEAARPRGLSAARPRARRPLLESPLRERSTSSFVVRKLETEIRIAARPCQSVPPSQQVPSSWTRRRPRASSRRRRRNGRAPGSARPR